MVDRRVQDFVQALEPGHRLWLVARGKSLWPILIERDQLLIECCLEASLQVGEIALLINGEGELLAHLVAARFPLRTVSSVGVADEAGHRAVGRVVAVRRGNYSVALPSVARHFLRHVPQAAMVLKRLPGLRGLVHLVRDPR